MNFPEKSLQRRITQTLKGKAQTFFAVCRPGFEPIASHEIKKLTESEVHKTAIGGLEFSCKQESLWKLHLQALTLNSIRMRIASFRAGTVGELASKIKTIPWELYLYKESPIEINSHFSHCRIEDAPLATAIVKREIYTALTHCSSFAQADNPKKKPLLTQTIYLLGEDNHYKISIDCSGKRFFARGYRPYIGEAPLRESTASLLLLTTKFFEHRRLFIPMCGSGTLLLEALSYYARDLKGFLPSENRIFPFMEYPSFRPAAYNHLKEKLKQGPYLSELEWEIQSIVATDIDSHALEATEKNLAELLRRIPPLNEEKKLPSVEIAPADFFDLEWWEKRKLTSSDVVLLNPPYGKRLSINPTFFPRLGEFLNGPLKGVSVGVISPQDKRKWMGNDWKIELPFFNGGIQCFFLIR